MGRVTMKDHAFRPVLRNAGGNLVIRGIQPIDMPGQNFVEPVRIGVSVVPFRVSEGRPQGCPSLVFEHQAPNGRSRSRLMIWRWISDVPSQIRSTRASRQKRASGRSSINPMPPWIWIAASVTRASISDA